MKTIMKLKKYNTYLTCFVFLALGTRMYSQRPEIIYDFNKGEFENNNYIKDGKLKPMLLGGLTTFKIINVNTFRWKVEIEGRSINYVTPIPSELQTLFRLAEQEESTKKTEDGVAETQAKSLQMTEVSTEIANRDALTKSNEVKALENAMKQLVVVCNEYLKLSKEVAKIKFRRVELINLCKHKWVSHDKMKEKIPTLLSESSMRQSYESFVAYYAKAESAYQIALTLAKSAASASTASSIDKANVEVIKNANEGIEKGYALITEENFLKQIVDIMVLQEAMANPEYFNVTSPPIQMEGDFVAFSIKTTPASTHDLMPYEFGKNFAVEIPVKGGLKVDFSVGPVFSFGPKSRDEKYYVETVTKTDSVIFKQRDNNNAISPGLAAMMHIYKRTGKNIAFGGLFGVGAGFQTVQDANFSTYFGGSIIMGKREKVMLNFGVSYLSVDRLKNKQFVPEQIYPKAEIDVSNLTEKVFKPSLFLSVSYNLTNRVEIK